MFARHVKSLYICKKFEANTHGSMLYISFPPGLPDKRLPFYLAAEEYVARKGIEEDCFFMWQVNPTVIFGRNQLIENEVNLDYCRKHGIEVYRRKSGGGCVYADRKNIMFSYITHQESVGFTYNRYITMVMHMLHRLGVNATASGRNDIMIGDRKVSGSAFYKIPGCSIVHGTMLYDTDMQNMVGAITPSDAKLLSKGVQSVRQRIALLKDYINLDIEAFKAFAKEALCNGERCLDEADLTCIEEIEKEYLTDEFIYGCNPRYSVVRKGRIEGVGEMVARVELKNGLIKGISLMGDYFLTGDLDRGLLDRLKDVPLTAEALSHALPDRVDDIIMNLKKNDLIKLLTDQTE